MDFIPELKPVFIGDAHRALHGESFDAIKSRTLANVEIANQNGELVLAGKHLMEWPPP